MRVLVCGGRNYFDREYIFATLDHYHSTQPFTVLIHGAATGADSIAGEWGVSRLGIDNVKPFPADWDLYGYGAGPRRNSQMLREGRPNLVIAFPGDTGTLNMTLQAKRAGVPVLDIPGRVRE